MADREADHGGAGAGGGSMQPTHSNLCLSATTLDLVRSNSRKGPKTELIGVPIVSGSHGARGARCANSMIVGIR